MTAWNALFPIIASLRPAGGKRSSKRDRILSIFLRQEGHLSADDLFDLVRREDAGIGRATVYRTLQWMVGAGIARKVDFGEGRSRFEPSYRHPRHFHLICNTCHRSSEFLSSDVESLHRGDRRRAQLRRRPDRRADLRHLRGVPDRAGKTPPLDGATTELVFARDALRIAIATERSGLEFYTRAASLTKRCARPRRCSRSWPPRSASTSARSRSATGAGRRRIRSSNRGRRSCSSRARRTACSPRAPSKLREGVDDQQALLIGIKCERGSHKFFKRYGERFEDSEGKQIFLEFADEERAHLDLLIREYRALRDAPGAASGRRARSARRQGRRRTARSVAAVDRSSHPHDRVRRPLHAGGARRARGGGRRHRAERHRSRHRGRLRRGRRGLRGAPASSSSPASRSPRSSTAPTSTCSGTSSTRSRRRSQRSSPEQRQRRARSRARMIVDRLAAHGIALDADAILAAGARRPVDVGRAAVDRARAGRRRARRRHQRGVRPLAGARPPGVRPADGRAARGSLRAHPRRGRHRVAGASRRWSAATSGFRRSRRPASTRSRPTTRDHDAAATARYLALAGSAGPGRVAAAPTTTATSRTALAVPAACRCRAIASIG